MIIMLPDVIFRASHFLQQQGVENADFEAREIVLFSLKIDRKDALLIHEFNTDEMSVATAKELLLQRASGLPLQYVLGEWDFFGRTFSVRRDVLIPRPETEELTQLAVAWIRKNNCECVFDVCCGTGCIGISVALECPQTQVYLFDLYDAPLHCTADNIKRFGINNAHLISCDVLSLQDFTGLPQPDVIISNPPYIPSNEMSDLQLEVQYEPVTALDGGKDGLVFYRALSQQWYSHLKEGGRLYLECAQDQQDRIMSLFPVHCFNASGTGALKDFYGLERFVCLQK